MPRIWWCLLCFLIIFSSGLLNPKSVSAAVRTWDGGGADGTCGGGAGDGNKWSCALNWSADSIPGSTDTATFDSTSTKNATVDASYAGSVQGIDINTGYSGTITLSRSITIGNLNYDQNAGQFDAGSQTIDLNGTFALTGGIFNATTGTFTASGGFSVTTGTFNHNNGTVTFDASSTGTITCSSTTFNLVAITRSSSNLTVASGCTIPISGTNPTIGGNESLTILNSGIINVTGNPNFAGGYTANSGSELNISGTTLTFAGPLTLTAGIFPLLATSLTLGNNLTNTGNLLPNGMDLTISGSGSATMSCGTATFNSVNITTSAGNFTINNGCTFPLSGSNPSVGGSGLNVINSGIINATGNITINGTYTSGITGQLNITGTQITVTSDLTLTTGSIDSDFTTLVVGGNVDNSGNALPNGLALTLNLGNTPVITCGNATFTSLTISKSVATNPVTIGSTCDFTMAGSNPSSQGNITNNGTIRVTGNWTITGSYTASSGSVLTMSGTTLSVSNTLTLTAGTFPQGITTLSVNSLSNTGNLLPNGLDVTTIINSNSTFNCGTAVFNSWTLSMSVNTVSVALTSNCTTGNLTSTVGYFSNPASARTLFITGNYSQTNLVTQGGANLTFEFSSSGTQTFSMTTGTFSSKLNVNKSGGSLSLITPMTVTTQTCDITEGVFDLNGNNFVCGSTFTVQDGGTLRLYGNESPTTPTLSTGSTVSYKGDGDSVGDNYLPKDWSYKHMTVNMTDSSDVLNLGASDTLSTSLVGYWKMDENTGTTVEDSSSNNNTATKTNAVFTTTTIPGLSVSNTAAMDFDGTGDYLDIGNNLSIAQNQSVISVAALIRKDSNSSTDSIFGLSTGTSTSNSRIDFGTSSDEVYCAGRAGDAESTYTKTTTATNLSTGGWYSIACVINYASDTIDIYVNGISQTATGTISFTASSTSNTASLQSAIGIDEDKSGNDFDGQIDELRIYTKALNQSELNYLAGGYVASALSSLTTSNNFTLTSGNFVAPTTLTVGGNFSNSATFTHNSGTVVLNGTGQSLSGVTTFNNFTKNITSPADTLSFPPSTTQTFVGTMDLRGTSGNLLSLGSSDPPDQWRIDPQGTRTIAYLDVSNSNNVNSTPIQTSGFNITDSDGNNGWDFGATSEPYATSPTSLSQSGTGNGYITFLTTLSDGDNSNTRLKVEYSDNGGSNWYDPDLVSVTPSGGSTDLDDSQNYQIGTVNPVDTSGGQITLTIVWDSQSGANGNGSLDDTDQTDIKLRVIPNDTSQDGDTKTSSNFEVDNLNPTAPGSFTNSSATGTTVSFTWTASTETNFNNYEIWYGTNQSDVENRTGTAVEWDNSDDTDLSTSATTDTSITGLEFATGYYFKIWAVDDYSNQNNSTNTVSTSTSTLLTWDGGAGTSTWSDATNWDADIIPNSSTDVLINSNVTVNITASTTINSLTIGNSGGTTSPTLNFSYDAITNGALVLDSGNLIVYSAAIITHTVGTSSVVGTINFDIQSGNATITGTINADSKGYGSALGTGAGSSMWASASHGGRAGYHDIADAPGPSYGSIKNPITLGSGAGNSSSCPAPGGGAVKLTVSGTTTITGSITVNGTNGGTLGGGGCGAGAGGSVNLTTGTLSGNGSITSNGGNAGEQSSPSGGGAGGRIAISYTTDSSTLTTTAYGKAAYVFLTGQSGGGGAGTIFKKASSQTNGDLFIDNNDAFSPTTHDLYNGRTFIDDTIAFDGITISNYGNLDIGSSANVSYSSLTWSNQGAITYNGGTFALLSDGSDVTIPATSFLIINQTETYNNFTVNGTLSHSSNTTLETNKLDLIITGNLTVASGGSINVDNRGFVYSQGTGQGIDGTGFNGGGGAGYGGAGGDGTGQVGSGGSTYGSLQLPVNIGSGGGGGPSACGVGIASSGGGAVKLTVSDTTTITGSITADGQKGCDHGGVESGGGSGGSVYITTLNLLGAGTVSADGGYGNANGAGDGGGGGGGRIAYYVADDTSSITYTATGGQGQADGTDGTIYPRQAPSSTTPASISQAGTGTGYVTFLTSVTDNDFENTKLKVEFSDNGGTTWYDAHLVSVTPASGSVDLDNSLAYQIGTANPIDSSSGTVNMTIVWDSQSTSNGNGGIDNTRQTDIRIRVTPNDTILDGVPKSTSNIEVDNSNPSTPTLNLSSATNTILATWSAVSEDNFNHYEIWYGTNQSDVENRTGTASEWDDSDDATLTTRTTTSTTLTSLLAAQTYYLKLWAIDNYGNESTSAVNSTTTSSGNATPDLPTSLGHTGLVGGGWTNDTTPEFSFTINDSDSGNTVKFRLQVDDSSDFSSPAVDHTSTLAAQGSQSYTPSALSDGSYYWRVKAIDNSGAESAYVTANSGNVAFGIDTVSPVGFDLSSPADDLYTNNQRVNFVWLKTTDARSGLSKYEVIANNSSANDFTIPNIPISGSESYIQDRYTSSYSTDTVTVFTKSSSAWGTTSNDGKMGEGEDTWQAKAYDNAGNSISGTRTLFVDLTGPTVNEVEIEGIDVLAGLEYSTSNRRPVISGKATDSLSSGIASGISRVDVEFEVKNSLGVYVPYSIYQVNITKNYFESTDAEITDNTLNTNNKYGRFTFTPTQDLPIGDYLVSITAVDKAGNTGGIRQSRATIAVSTLPTPTPGSSVLNPTVTPIVSDTPRNSIQQAVNNIGNSVSNSVSNGISKTSQAIVNSYKHFANNLLLAINGTSNFISDSVSEINQTLPSGLGNVLAAIILPFEDPLENLKIKLAITAETWLDEEPTRIFNVQVIQRGHNYAIIRWETNHHATGKINYGLSFDYGMDVQTDQKTLVHIFRIDNLEPDTTYYYEVMSQNKNYVYDARHEFDTLGLGSSPQIVSNLDESIATDENKILLAGNIVEFSNNVSVVTAVSTVTFATIGLGSALIAPFIPIQIFTKIPHDIISLLVGMGFLRRKKKSQGLVFDSRTGLPLPNTYMVFFSASGNLHLTYSDSYGRFRVKAKPDDYQLRTEKKGYIFPSKIITTPQTAEHSHIYLPGQTIPIIGEQVLNLSVPMDPTLIRNLPLVTKLIKQKILLGIMLSRLQTAIHITLFLVTTYSVLVNTSWLNFFSWVIVFMSGLISIKGVLHGNKNWGRIVNSVDGKGISEVVVKLYRYETPNDMYSAAISDQQGRYVFAPENGKYQIRVYKVQELLYAGQVEVTDHHPNVDLVIKLGS
jgi:hypothetical protein